MCKYIETGDYKLYDPDKVLEIEDEIYAPMIKLKEEGFTNVQGTDFMDALVAAKVGYDKRNVRSNDFDAKSSKNGGYLENKRVSGVAKGLYAEFPDLNREGVKLEELKKGVLITVSCCPVSHILEYFLVVNSADIYPIIEEKFNEAKTKNRSNVRIPLKDLLFCSAPASIIANTKFFTKEIVCDDLKQKSKRYFGKINPNFIYTLEDADWVVRQHMDWDSVDDYTALEAADQNLIFKTRNLLICSSKHAQDHFGAEPSDEYLHKMFDAVEA